jgi:hypothetical protein
MKINVEKRLHELAQWHENEARNLREHSTSPSMPELADRHHYTAEIMRLARIGLSVKTNKIIALEESLRQVLEWAGPIAGDNQDPESARIEEASIDNAMKALGEKE